MEKYQVLCLSVGVLVVFGIVHAINWITAKMIIYIAMQLFNTDWSGKFWSVYFLLLIVNAIIRGISVSFKTK